MTKPGSFLRDKKSTLPAEKLQKLSYLFEAL